MPPSYYTPYGDYAAPYRVKVCAQHATHHELLETRNGLQDFAAVRACVALCHARYPVKFGSGVNRVYCEVLDAIGYYVPPSIWDK